MDELVSNQDQTTSFQSDTCMALWFYHLINLNKGNNELSEKDIDNCFTKSNKLFADFQFFVFTQHDGNEKEWGKLFTNTKTVFQLWNKIFDIPLLDSIRCFLEIKINYDI